MPGTRPAAVLLYYALVGGFATILGTFGYLFFLGVAPLLDTDQQLIALAVTGAGAPSLLLGWFWVRPRVTGAAPGTTTEEYWSVPATAGKALLLWVLCEGAGIMGAVGFLMTGHLLCGSLAAIAMASLLLNGPNHLYSRPPTA